MPKPTTKTPTQTWSEDAIQMYVATQALRDGYLFHGDQNAGQRRNGAKCKLMGMRKGWPDMCFILPSRIVYIELKAAKGVVSKEQTELHERMRSMGCDVHVVKSVDGNNAWEQICRILKA